MNPFQLKIFHDLIGLSMLKPSVLPFPVRAYSHSSLKTRLESCLSCTGIGNLLKKKILGLGDISLPLEIPAGIFIRVNPVWVSRTGAWTSYFARICPVTGLCDRDCPVMVDNPDF